MKLCVTCKHFLSRGRMWYDQYCKAVQHPKGVDPVTGEKVYRKKNDLGGYYYDDEPYEYARNVNNGDCMFWEGRSEEG